MDTRSFNFEIVLELNCQPGHSRFDLFIDDQTLQTISVPGQHILQSHHDLNRGSHRLGIRYDKLPDTYGLLHIQKIVFNGIDLDKDRYIVWSRYLLDQPQLVDGAYTSVIDQCVHLGHSGQWYIDFQIPVFLHWRHMKNLGLT